MRSPTVLFERIPVMFFILSVPKRCKRKKALITEPKSVWDCLGDLTYKEGTKTHTNKTRQISFVLDCLCLFVNSKEAHNAKKVFS